MTMETINEIQDEIIEEFSSFDDWMDKYQLLIDLGSDQAVRAAYGCRLTMRTASSTSGPRATPSS